MSTTQPLPPDFDADGPASPHAGLYGLGTMPEEAGVIVVPVPFEATVSYGSGTAQGPAAVLAASSQVDLFDPQTGKPYEQGIAMIEAPPEISQWSAEGRAAALRVIDAGGPHGRQLELLAKTVDGFSQGVNMWVRKTVRAALDAGKTAFVLGGDHSVPFGAIDAYAEQYPGLGILHLDAHLDLRSAYEGFTWSHASIMHNVLTRIPGVAGIVHVGVRDLGVSEVRFSVEQGDRSIIYDDYRMRDRVAAGETWRQVVDEIAARLPDAVYVSYDIDGLDPALCPGTGTPVPGGLSFYEAVSLLDAVVRSGRTIVGGDLCEVAPAEGDQQWNANVGARLLYKMIGFAAKSRRERS